MSVGHLSMVDAALGLAGLPPVVGGHSQVGHEEGGERHELVPLSPGQGHPGQGHLQTPQVPSDRVGVLEHSLKRREVVETSTCSHTVPHWLQVPLSLWVTMWPGTMDSCSRRWMSSSTVQPLRLSLNLWFWGRQALRSRRSGSGQRRGSVLSLESRHKPIQANTNRYKPILTNTNENKSKQINTNKEACRNNQYSYFVVFR